MKKLMMVLAAMVALNAIADKEVVDGIEWRYMIFDGEATVGLYGEQDTAIPITTQGAIVIPSVLGGCPVRTIAAGAFDGCKNLTSVEIPSSIQDVWDYSFSGCSGLTSITIAEGVENLGAHAFMNCTSLNALTIPASVSRIGWCLCRGCDNLKEIRVATGNKTFKSINGLLVIRNTDRLWMCPGGIMRGAFEIPSTIKSLGNGAFSGCHNLTSVIIPASVTDISSSMFMGCECLAEISVSAKNLHFKSTQGVLFSKDMSQLLRYPEGKRGSHYVIPAGVAIIGKCAFLNCTGITSLTIPLSVTSVAETAFTYDGVLGVGTAASSKVPLNLATIYVAQGDSERIRNLFEESQYDMSRVTFVEETESTSDPSDDPVADSFTGEKAMTFNGLVYDADGVMCGMAQITTAKATKKGVKVGGFVMLADGKKQSLKAATVPIENGQLDVSTKAGKTDLTLTITGDGFKGTLGDMTLASADVDEDTGILSGTLKMSYFDAKTGKIKTKSIKLTGVTSDGEAVGGLTVKGHAAQSFEAKVAE